MRTDPDAPKHKGISYLLIDMHSQGVTVRPLVQMTGGKGFNEVFFEDVRVPKKNIVGERNNGWQVAMTTLMFERGSGGGEGYLGEVHELARARQANPAQRQQRVGRFERAAARRGIRGRSAGASIHRLSAVDASVEGDAAGARRLDDETVRHRVGLKIALYAMELLGPFSQLEFNAPFAVDKGKWSFRMLAARGPTIYAGTNQIQHNIIGERVLGLPKG